MDMDQSISKLVVLTETEEFIKGIKFHPHNNINNNNGKKENVFMAEDEDVGTSKDPKKEHGGLVEFSVLVGKGLSGALNLLKEEGGGVVVKETYNDWAVGRNTDKKKSKLVGMFDDAHDNDGGGGIQIVRRDKFGRNLTPKEAFRLHSYKFHGKGPGKKKQEKRRREYEMELKMKKMRKNGTTDDEVVERMREAQAQLKTPYLVLTGNVKPGQTRDHIEESVNLQNSS